MDARYGLVLAIAVSVAISCGSAACGACETCDGQSTPRIQIAILLDTSGSMTGLIEQAKSQLWRIVNEFATTKRDGKTPKLQVALYQYGTSSIPASEGYLRMILPLTTDLDRVSEELFALRTNGSQEYCGTVIKAAAEGLAWSASNDDLKAIFIAGNEPFTQGEVDYRFACGAAAGKGITVNTIHCGSCQAGIAGKWRHGATLAEGGYTNINHNHKVVHIAAPQDKEIARLGLLLNSTYVAYGAAGRRSIANQCAQDRNALGLSAGANVQRQAAKASVHYRNDSWDLVDGTRTGKVRLEILETKELPEEMREMSLAERKAYIEKQAKRRTTLQVEIRRLNDERGKYVAVEMKTRGKSGDHTLDTAIITIVREQAKRKGFKSNP